MVKTKKKESGAGRRISDLVGIDFSTTATKVVRLKTSRGICSLTGIELLPAVNLSDPDVSLDLPRHMLAHYGCLVYSGESAVIRMVNAPLEAEQDGLPEDKLRELLNVDTEFRTSARLISRGKGRQDSGFLAAAMPQNELRSMLGLFPSGPPAPASLEVAGLSFVPAFIRARGIECGEDAVCLLDAGETVSHFVLLNRGTVSLVGKLNFGVRTLREKLKEDLGVDNELAAGIVTDASINISGSVRAVMAPFLKQLSISMDFLQRQQGCRIEKVFISGGMSLLPTWGEEIGLMLSKKILKWSPLENMEYDSGTVPEDLEQQATRFAAAIGAAIGGLGES